MSCTNHYLNGLNGVNEARKAVTKMAEQKYQQTIYFPQSIRQQLKVLAAENNMTVSEVATKAVKLLLEQEKNK